MSQNEIGMWHSLGGVTFNVGHGVLVCQQKRRATTLQDVSVCNYVLKLILNWDVRLFGRDVDVIVGGWPLINKQPRREPVASSSDTVPLHKYLVHLPRLCPETRYRVSVQRHCGSPLVAVSCFLRTSSFQLQSGSGGVAPVVLT